MMQVLESVVQYRDKLNNIEHLVERNAVICDGIVEHALNFYGIDKKELQEFIKEQEKAGQSPDRTSVQQSLKHYVRDWAKEGAHERDAAFPCILETLETLYPGRNSGNSSAAVAKVLLPGAGLGALGHEVASLGGLFDLSGLLRWGDLKLICNRVRSRPERMVHLHDCRLSLP